MAEEYSGNIYSITDEDGNVYELEHLDTIEINGVYYLAFLPADNPDDGMVILKNEVGEDGDEYLVIPTDEEQEAAYEQFMTELFDDEQSGDE